MGNALVVGLIEQMGRRLKELADEEGSEGREHGLRSSRGAVIGPLDRCNGQS